tara:strand:+ start:141 stop:365 length:225 start_codon:yes stop_codon:yes gene_type:complete
MRLPNEFIITNDYEAKLYDETIEEMLTADIYTLNIEADNMLEETKITYINHDTGEVISSQEEILEWLSYLPKNK